VRVLSPPLPSLQPQPPPPPRCHRPLRPPHPSCHTRPMTNPSDARALVPAPVAAAGRQKPGPPWPTVSRCHSLIPTARSSKKAVAVSERAVRVLSPPLPSLQPTTPSPSPLPPPPTTSPPLLRYSTHDQPIRCPGPRPRPRRRGRPPISRGVSEAGSLRHGTPHTTGYFRTIETAKRRFNKRPEERRTNAGKERENCGAAVLAPAKPAWRGRSSGQNARRPSLPASA
jgi:hypothetical protein